MGLYNLTMVISTGFTVGLNVNDLYFSIRFHYLMSNYFKLLRGRNLNDLEKGRDMYRHNFDRLHIVSLWREISEIRAGGWK